MNADAARNGLADAEAKLKALSTAITDPEYQKAATARAWCTA